MFWTTAKKSRTMIFTHCQNRAGFIERFSLKLIKKTISLATPDGPTQSHHGRTDETCAGLKNGSARVRI